MTLGDGFDQSQPQTDAAVALTRAWRTVKRLENPFAQLSWYAWAVVGDT
jgi:hypothetical protein